MKLALERPAGLLLLPFVARLGQKFPVFVLSHLLSALLDYTSHCTAAPTFQLESVVKQSLKLNKIRL
jgi:hypothetical protein